MKKVILGLLLVVIVVGSFYIASNRESSSVSDEAMFSKSDISLEFKYPTGEEGYKLIEISPDPSQPLLVKTIVLQSTKDAMATLPEGGEYPPAISVNIFKNAEKQWPQTWADANPLFSNINLIIGEASESVVGGAKAILYKADGLYVSSNAVVTSGEYVYVFTGQYLDEISQIAKDFEKILSIVSFIPKGDEAGTPQAKIDPRVACLRRVTLCIIYPMYHHPIYHKYYDTTS